MTPSAAQSGTQLVVIADPACSSCEEAATELRDRAPSLGVAPLIVSNGSARDTAAFAQRAHVAVTGHQRRVLFEELQPPLLGRLALSGRPSGHWASQKTYRH